VDAGEGLTKVRWVPNRGLLLLMQLNQLSVYCIESKSTLARMSLPGKYAPFSRWLAVQGTGTCLGTGDDGGANTLMCEHEVRSTSQLRIFYLKELHPFPWALMALGSRSPVHIISVFKGSPSATLLRHTTAACQKVTAQNISFRRPPTYRAAAYESSCRGTIPASTPHCRMVTWLWPSSCRLNMHIELKLNASLQC
jgi:hypothetical protein